MRMRDRRGPLTALVLFVGYLLLAIAALVWVAAALGFGQAIELTPALTILLAANFAAFLWRGAMRFAFTTREYAAAEWLRAVLRFPITNIIAIMAGRRAFVAYVGTLAGQAIAWDKTQHFDQPARGVPQKTQRAGSATWLEIKVFQSVRGAASR